MKYLSLFILSSFVALSAAIIPTTQSASALTGVEWSAGRIIDDSVFTNSTSMTLSEVQWFLMSKLPTCDNYGTGSVNGTTRAAYADAKGNPKPTGRQVFTCLKDYYEVPKTAPGAAAPVSNYGYVSGNAPAGSKSAAQLILDAAQAYNISPKVLLVTLQKEQGLITDDWPTNNQYLYAMGAHCPDGVNGAECDPNYAGFSLQMRESAKLLRGYLEGMTQSWWSYKKPYKVNDILWNVSNTNCGSSNVYVETMATAALYTYTPYQPNQAALNNLYGTGDRCSAYGNRNFWRLFSDWFVTTKGDLFQASLVTQSVYPTVIPGQSQAVTIKYRNTGQWTWHDSTIDWPGIPPLYLAASSGPSMFSYGWPSLNVPATTFSRVYESDGTSLSASQNTANPGQIVEFTFNVTAPWTAQAANYRASFKPIISGTTINLGQSSETTYNINVPPYFQSDLVTQSVYPDIAPGEGKSVSIKYRNTGQWSWHDSTVDWPGMPALTLATVNNTPSIYAYGWPSASVASTVFNKVYEANGTALAANQHVVNNGQIVEFTFNLTAPWSSQPGAYSLALKPKLGTSNVDFGANAISLMGLSVPAWRAANVGQSGYPTAPRGQAGTAFIRYKNTGAWAWHDSTVNWPGSPEMILMTADRSNNMFAYGWPSGDTPTTVFNKVYEANGTALAANQHVAYQGQIVEFSFPMTTPWSLASGSYRNDFKPYLRGNDIDLSSLSLSRMYVNVP